MSPLKKGSGKKTISANIAELMRGAMGAIRKKGVATMAKKRGMSAKKARQKMAAAIAYSQAGKSKKKK